MTRPMRQGGVVAYRSRWGTTQYGVRSGFAASDKALTRLHSLLLGHADVPIASPGRLLLSLVLDGVLERAALPMAWQALWSRYRVGAAIAIEWTMPPGRLDRRYLGLTTLAGLREVQPCPLRAAQDDLADLLWRTAIVSERPTPDDAVAYVLDAASALLVDISTDWYAHVTGRQPLTPVPRSSLARLVSGNEAAPP